MMALAFLLIGLVPGVTTVVAPFVVLFGTSYFFTEFGPNTTTFIYPAEIFPVDVRTTGHGVSAAAGKWGHSPVPICSRTCWRPPWGCAAPRSCPESSVSSGSGCQPLACSPSPRG